MWPNPWELMHHYQLNWVIDTRLGAPRDGSLHPEQIGLDNQLVSVTLYPIRRIRLGL